jgi:hypothetical protein
LPSPALSNDDLGALLTWAASRVANERKHYCQRHPEDYYRGGGSPAHATQGCGANLSNEGGKCYPVCKPGYTGQDVSCIIPCPPGKVACGTGCIPAGGSCGKHPNPPAPHVRAEEFARSLIAASPVGPAMPAKQKAAVEVVKQGAANRGRPDVIVPVPAAIAPWVEDFVGAFEAMTSKTVAAEIDRRLSPRAARWVKEQYAMGVLGFVMRSEGVEYAEAVMGERAGLASRAPASIAQAYSSPRCTDPAKDPFPAVKPLY